MTRTLCAGLLLGWLAAPATAADLAALVASGGEVKKLVGDCKFTEGPAYSPHGFLLFSDIPNNRIVRVNDDGAVSDYLKPSGAANGLLFDAAGHLYVCQGGARRVVRISGIDGKIEVLAEKFEGKRINSPNDLALDGQGGLYFTDPRYGKTDDVEQPVMGVYYVSSAGAVSRVIDALPRPNGILVSPDGKTLSVANPNAREIRQYAITGPGKLGDSKVIFTGDQTLDGGGPDGMAHDADGRIYATYKTVVVLNTDGSLVGRIPVPEQPANCKFGGKDGKTLFITARTSLYGLPMNVAGAKLMPHGPKPTPQLSLNSPPKSGAFSFAPPAKGGLGGGLPTASQNTKIQMQKIKTRTPPNPPLAGGANAGTPLARGAKEGTPLTGGMKMQLATVVLAFAQADAKSVTIQDITLTVPPTWKQQEPSSRLRAGQFGIPPVEGDKDPADLAISFFGGDGGGVDANLKRWTDQFTGEDKKVKLSQGTAAQGTYYFSEVSGTYQKPIGPPIAGKKEPTPGYRSLNVILQVPEKGNYFLRLIGPDKTVTAAAAAFRTSFGGDAAKEKPYEMK